MEVRKIAKRVITSVSVHIYLVHRLPMEEQEIIPHLFRTEYRKIVSVLVPALWIRPDRRTAEDITADTFAWRPHKAGPITASLQEPCRMVIHRGRRTRRKITLQRGSVFENKVAPGSKNNSDRSWLKSKLIYHHKTSTSCSQLQMMSSHICHPSIPPERHRLAYRCAFFAVLGLMKLPKPFYPTRKPSTNGCSVPKKSCVKAMLKLSCRAETEIDERLAPVLTTIYLLFNEGYYSVSQNQTLRKDLCFEAIRLCTMLVEKPNTLTNRR